MSSGSINNKRPGVVIVPGAFHTPAHFEVLRAALEEQGYEVYAPRLPTLGNTGVTCIDDAKAAQAAVEERMDDGKEFVVVAHSYGGIPGCAAVKGFTVKERAEAGKRGGFRAILFLAAFALPEPNDLLAAFGGEYPYWMSYDTPYTGNGSAFIHPTAKDAFYNGIPENEAERYYSLCERQSQAAFETPVDCVPSNCGIPHTYLICEDDQAMPVAFQEMITSMIPTLKVERVASGHSPFITHPQRVIEVLSAM